MSRLPSVAFTEQAVVERRKTVTRRKGWWTDKNGRRLLVPGDRLTLCRKIMGRKLGEPLVRICEVEVVSVTREPLRRLYDWEASIDATHYAVREVAKEGFRGMGPALFVHTYFLDAQGMQLDDDVTRIEWRYLDGEDGTR